MLDQEMNFYLKGNPDFNDRQKSVFLALDKLSAGQPENRYTCKESKELNVTIVKDRKDLKQFVGKESIFKRPEAALNKCFKLKIPEFIKNPHKWKKYSLGDDEISDHSNRIVAMSFLKALKERHSKEGSGLVEVKESGSKPIFNKYLKDTGLDLAEVDDNAKPSFMNGKIIMPEYVVGQKIKRVSKKRHYPETSGARVKLEHLLDE